jgi:2-oxoglutarate dehydrogenase E1 component
MKLEDLTEKQREKIEEFGMNTWYVLDLYSQYKRNPDTVSGKWKKFFDTFSNGEQRISTENNEQVNGKKETGKRQENIKAIEKIVNIPLPSEGEDSVPIRGVGAKIIENMEGSLTIPTATSLRVIPVKLLEENRLLINQHLKKTDSGKISFTHIIGWAIIKAAKEFPVMNNAFTVINGEPNVIKKKDINLGLAVDIEKKDGSRSLIVPNIKKADKLDFREYFDAYNDVINKSRAGKIEVSDFQGTSITLTNPGTIGTISSNPRLMAGQGTIIATGSIQYPAEFKATSPEVISKLGISKVMNITSTYDHRIIQGAESGLFLKRIDELLLGSEGFYEEIFNDLEIPLKPAMWLKDNNPEDFVGINNLEEIEKQAHAIQLINMYRVRGHLLANLDPLQPSAQYHPELDPAKYGLSIWDYDRTFITEGLAGLRSAPLREILDILQKTYCDKIGVEYRHIQDVEEKLWLQQRMETVRNTPDFDKEIKKQILLKLIQAESFERFIHTKYLGHKRFSIEGSETIIPVLDMILELAAEDDVQEIILGMAHRGRLNVLANVIGKPLDTIFHEFEDIVDPNTPQGSGDVKYHLGASGTYETLSNKKIKASIASNPSHLEFVNPVVEGIVRAKQTRLEDTERNKIISVLLHGDAAFAGQGIVAETLNLSQLKGYTTGGSIHIIINNQIGFTTLPVEARSTVYASDVAKMIQSPVFHVNGDDPEASLWCAKLVYEYKKKFKKDVVIDVFGYRRHGHNEGDDPSYTQPIMYKLIKEHPPVREIYQKKILREKSITEEDVKEIESAVSGKLNEAYEKAKQKSREFKTDIPLAVTKEEILAIKSEDSESPVPLETLNKVVNGLTYMPDNFNLHPKLRKFIESRKEFLDKDIEIDWAFGEALAFGSLLLEGIPVRLSGQDSSRGTFSQRHAILTNALTGEDYIPLNNISDKQAKIEPLDSLLSELAVVGFEYGYSTADPLTLVLWEAQFGDFVNGAQVIIDNFVVSSYTKWRLPNSLVFLLPHGQEGQGPEHSSARVERFLTLCAENNMIVTNPSTPANYFHLLRRQAKEKIRRPLVILTPKSLLRDKAARSLKKEFTDNKFQKVIDDNIEKNSVKRILMTSGKVYYDLWKHRKENNLNAVAIVRIEQFYPYPSEQIREVLAGYTNAKEIIWVQEEPANMGVLNFITPRLRKDLSKEQQLYSISRKESPSPAPGSRKVYEESQRELIEKSFKLKNEKIEAHDHVSSSL